MTVFYILLLVPVMLQHFTIGTNNIDYQKKNNRALAFFFFFLTVLVALRHESVGNDTGNYIYQFEKISALDWSHIRNMSTEVGFSYFIKIISAFSDDYRVFLIASSVMPVAMIYPTYKRLCTDASLIVVLYCTMSTFVMMFSGIRQMIAIGFGFLAYELVRKKKPVLFLIVVFLALTFHTSAFMLIFMYPLYHTKITKKWLVFVVPALGALFVFNRQVFSVLAMLIERFTGYDAAISQTNAYTMIILFAVFLVFSFLIPDESIIDKETIGLRNFMIFSFVLQMFAPLHTLAMRMNYYYIIFIPLFLPNIIRCRSERWSQVAVVARHAMIIVFLAYFFLIMSSSSGNLHVFPYHFFWENL